MSNRCESDDLPILPPAGTQGLSFGASRDKFPHIGAIVALKSGGPRMMVVDYVANGLTVSWRHLGEAVERSFPFTSLQLVSPL